MTGKEQDSLESHRDMELALQVEMYLNRISFSRKNLEEDGLTASEHIVIRSLSAAGKTSLIALLKSHFCDFHFEAGGNFMKLKAVSLNMTMLEFVKHSKEYPEKGYDRQCDAHLHHTSLTHPRTVFDARFPCAPNGYQVLLTCPLSIRATRRFAQLFPNDPCLTTGKVINELSERDKADERLNTLYPGSMWQPWDYDLVIPTDLYSKEQVRDIVLRGYAQWRMKTIKERCPRRSLVYGEFRYA